MTNELTLQSTELEPKQRLSIVFDSGNRPIVFQGKPLRSLLVRDGEIIKTSSTDLELKLSELNPSETLIIATSSTVDIRHYEEKGFIVYPSNEVISTVSNKKTLYDKCRELGIPTVLTFPLPQKAYEGDENILGKLGLLDEGLGGSIVKPENTYGPYRDRVEGIYNNTVDDFQQYSREGQENQVDFVVQRKLSGNALKAFGAWPDQYFYENDQGEILECPSNIKRTCRLLSEEFDVRWGGFDFMVNKDGTWLIIDINPSSGGRKISENQSDELAKTMQIHVEKLIKKEPLKKKGQKIVVMVAADRVIDLTQDEVDRVSKEIDRALQEEEVPYVVVGVKDKTSKHRYVTDSNGTILGYSEQNGSDVGIGVEKVAFGLNVAKVPVIRARNTYEVVEKQLRAGSLGRLIIIDTNTQVFDIDTENDLEEFKEQL